MSTNLLYNPNFDLPLITTNDYKYYTNFTAAEIADFYWTVGTNNTISLQNGTTAFGYASPSLLNLTQAISFQYDSVISQTITIFDLVTYQLRFNYVCRASYTINPLNVYINDVLVYNVSVYTTSWNEIIIDYTPTEFGNLTIKFETINDGNDRNICFTNIKFYKKPTTGGGGVPIPTSKMVTYNSLKNTNIYGYLNVNDYIVNGVTIAGVIKTPKIFVNNYDINNVLYTATLRASSNIFLNNVNLSTTFTTETLNSNLINYNYSTIPTYTTNNLGFITTLNYTGGTSIAANAYVNLTSSLPVGVYIIVSYALYTGAANQNTRLGMNTTINTLNTAYNYTQTFLPNATANTISYNYILKNNATTTYYFYYNSGGASTLTKYQVNILRIA